MKRVEILKSSGAGYFRTGQFAYVCASDNRGGMSFCHDSRESSVGEIAYLVTKAKHGRGGALWFAVDAIRFTTNRDLK
jgi:hypothetical protein